jgi:hypothetical protein
MYFNSMLSHGPQPSEAAHAAHLKEQAREVLRNAPSSPLQLFSRLHERFAGAEHPLGKVMLHITTTTYNRPNQASGEGSHIIPLRQKRVLAFWRSAPGLWMQQEWKYVSQSDMLGNSVKVWGPSTTLSKDAIERSLQDSRSLDSRNPGSDPWHSSSTIRNPAAFYTQLSQRISEAESPLNVAQTFDVADTLEPDNDVRGIVYQDNSRAYAIKATRDPCYGRLNHERLADCKARSVHRAFISFGSNMGDRVSMIETGLKKMEQHGLKITGTSSLWETAPMYVTEQGSFINGVCEVSL